MHHLEQDSTYHDLCYPSRGSTGWNERMGRNAQHRFHRITSELELARLIGVDVLVELEPHAAGVGGDATAAAATQRHGHDAVHVGEEDGHPDTCNTAINIHVC